MDAKNGGLHFSHKQALKLTSARHTCVVKVPHEMTLTMQPQYVSNIRHGLKENLDKYLLLYNKQLNGVPLSYNNIKIISSLCVDDLEVFKLKIKLLFVVFRPEPGKLLDGVVNKITDSHFGCILHKCINASVRQPDRFVLSNTQKATVNNIGVGDVITFKIWKFDVHHGIVIVLGDIYTECYQRIRRHSQSFAENEMPLTTSQPVVQTVVVNGVTTAELVGKTEEIIESNCNGEPPKKRKKRKNISSETNGDGTLDRKISPKKKKKKRDNSCHGIDVKRETQD